MSRFASVKNRLVAVCLSVAAAMLAAASARGADDAKKPDDRPVLAVGMSENLQNSGSAVDDFVRLDIAFEKVAKKRNWPVKLVAERFAGGIPDYETEVRIFSQPVRRETPVELVYRAWTSLNVKGKKIDFGIIEYRLYPRLGENMSDTLDKVYLGYANKVADKLEPILFPKPNQASEKPKS